MRYELVFCGDHHNWPACTCGRKRLMMTCGEVFPNLAILKGTTPMKKYEVWINNRERPLLILAKGFLSESPWLIFRDEDNSEVARLHQDSLEAVILTVSLA